MKTPNTNIKPSKETIKIVTCGKPIPVELLIVSIIDGSNAPKKIKKMNIATTPSTPIVKASLIPIHHHSLFPKIPRTFLDLT
jgi:hypothetical protein